MLHVTHRHQSALFFLRLVGASILFVMLATGLVFGQGSANGRRAGRVWKPPVQLMSYLRAHTLNQWCDQSRWTQPGPLGSQSFLAIDARKLLLLL
jgi:hypothetical protein